MSPRWMLEKFRRCHPLNSPSSEKMFAMLIAYMDDSGTHDGSHNCVIGGYWGSVNEWRRFERAWNIVIDSEDINEFHAKDFWMRIPGQGRVGPYKKWTDQRHAGFIDRLLGVIENAKIFPFACGVLGEAWDQLPSDRKELFSRNTKQKMQKPLFLSLQRAVTRTAGYCHAGITMHFTFDDDPSKSAVKGAITSTFLDVKALIKESGSPLYSHIGSLGFEDSEKAPPLQAADLLAYEAHRYAKATQSKGRRLVRIEYRRALRRFKGMDDFWLFDGRRFQTLENILQQSVSRGEVANEI